MPHELTFLFWNMGRRPVAAVARRLARVVGANILLLAECPSWDLTLAQLNEGLATPYVRPFSPSKRVLVLTTLGVGTVLPAYDSTYLSVRRVRLPGADEFLLAAAHLRSKLHRTGGSQPFDANHLGRAVDAVERSSGHRRTLLVGDLNMNPFEHGVVAADGLHAVSSRRVAERGTRTYRGTDCHFFYNPMWNLLGDATDGPPGTYYRRPSDSVEFVWHTLDQVLVRPGLLAGFPTESVRVVTSDGERSLLGKDGTPDRSYGSDHLPIVFNLTV